jgi:hypothetical protein
MCTSQVALRRRNKYTNNASFLLLRYRSSTLNLLDSQTASRVDSSTATATAAAFLSQQWSIK